MSRASTEALASHGSDANKRVLFFTYKFDFRWFHNFVLPKIRSYSTMETELLVIASLNEMSAEIQGHSDLG